MRRRGGILFVSAAAASAVLRESRVVWLEMYETSRLLGRAPPSVHLSVVQTGKQICIFQLKVPQKNEVTLYLSSADDAGVSKMKQFYNPKGVVGVFMGEHEHLNYLKRSIASSQPQYILITWLKDGNGLKTKF